jgi:hypothetical protein
MDQNKMSNLYRGPSATQAQPTEPLVLFCLLIEYVYIYTLQVIFGIPFGSEIDMWSVGCILAELYEQNEQSL